MAIPHKAERIPRPPHRAGVPAAAPTRYEYLDGIRGLAAVYVCAHHAYLEVSLQTVGGSLPGSVLRWGNMLLSRGHEAVDVFIVLSGFCLMLPSATTGQLRGGLRSYLLRRARRILPPYYVSLLLTFAMIAAWPTLRHPTGLRWDVLLPALSPGVIASHAFLVHNFSDRWCSKITGTAWSVATEWQIYFLFPVLLVVWRKAGNWGATALGFAVGIAAYCLLPDRALYGSCPWYLGLFAMGMAAASLTPSPDRPGRPGGGPRLLRSGLIWATLSLAALYLVKYVSVLEWGPVLRTIFRVPTRGYAWYYDAVIGSTAAALLLICRWWDGRPRSKANPIMYLESKTLVALGMFSYSLYLIHYPIISALHVAIHGLGLGPSWELVFMLGVASPAAVAASYVFYLAVERNFAPTAWKSPSRLDERLAGGVEHVGQGLFDGEGGLPTDGVAELGRIGDK